MVKDGEIYIADFPDGAPRQVTFEGDKLRRVAAGDWAPDGSRLLYVSSNPIMRGKTKAVKGIHPCPGNSNCSSLYLYDSGTGIHQLVATNFLFTSFTCSPTGTYLGEFACGEMGEPQSFKITSIQNGEIHWMAGGRECFLMEGAWCSQSWSPDGRYLYYPYLQKGCKTELRRFDVVAKKEETAASLNGAGDYLAEFKFRADGRLWMYWYSESKKSRIVIYDHSNASQSELTLPGEMYSNIVPARDGKAYAALTHSNSNTILDPAPLVRIDLKFGTVTEVHPLKGWKWAKIWCVPMGEKDVICYQRGLEYGADQRDERVAVLLDPETGEERILWPGYVVNTILGCY